MEKNNEQKMYVKLVPHPKVLLSTNKHQVREGTLREIIQ